MAKTGQHLCFDAKRGTGLKKSTPPPVVAVVTNMSYVHSYSINYNLPFANKILREDQSSNRGSYGEVQKMH